MCRSCDLTVSITQIKKHYDCICPRCGRKLLSNNLVKEGDVAIVAFAALIFLFISIIEPFMSISAMETGAAMSLNSIVSILNKQWGLLLYVFLFFTFFAPVSVLALIVFIGGFRLKPNIFLAKFYQFNHGMCMVDVFVLGIVVSLIKLTALADVTFYVGFYTTFIFSVLMIWCCLKFNPSILWEKIKKQSELKLIAGKSAMSQSYKVCQECGYVFKANDDIDLCPRCKSKVAYRRKTVFLKA